jgi:type IV pilus assembly protein PilO
MEMPEINFSELSIKEIGAWPLMLRVGVLAAIALITLIASYFFILQDQLTNLETQVTLNETKRKEFQDKYNLAANLDAYQKQMEKIKESYKTSLKELPASDQLPELIESISQQAEVNGLVAQSIKPGEPKTVLGFYKELPLKLTLQGTYNGLGGFISDISKIPRIITIHDFSIKRSGGGKNVVTPTDTLVLDVDAKTYWLSSEPDAPGKNSKTGKSSAKGATPAAGPAVPGVPGAAPGASLPGTPGAAPGVPGATVPGATP